MRDSCDKGPRTGLSIVHHDYWAVRTPSSPQERRLPLSGTSKLQGIFASPESKGRLSFLTLFRDTVMSYISCWRLSRRTALLYPAQQAGATGNIAMRRYSATGSQSSCPRNGKAAWTARPGGGWRGSLFAPEGRITLRGFRILLRF